MQWVTCQDAGPGRVNSLVREMCNNQGVPGVMVGWHGNRWKPATGIASPVGTVGTSGVLKDTFKEWGQQGMRDAFKRRRPDLGGAGTDTPQWLMSSCVWWDTCTVSLEASKEIWLEGRWGLAESKRVNPASLSKRRERGNAHPWKENHKNQQGFSCCDISALISAVVRVGFEGWASHTPHQPTLQSTPNALPNKHAS